ncbi:beta-galactosidase [Actibacterium sp. 188UL27-1]|uniref:beta-galactosidase n=1 Tax=Actibacterium sp. 188UL27-1 TaxID=2786961 RepID=UPI00195B621B|nr:beta-galactosidase [Actibacterium sp. 188UL27-1]
MSPKLGVCYYPEHWPEERWAKDAKRMVATGLTYVRIGEFAWAELEPEPGELNFNWLDRAIEILGKNGLRVVLGTPTATPPRWMVNRHPDMLALDATGQPRTFGSRRHYCFSHQGYRDACIRIVRILGDRYGKNPHIAAWQIDNEFGCHDTTLSYSPAAADAFREWLKYHYRSIEKLNRAWGNVFWSMTADNWFDIGLPNQTVTEPNPAHALAFRRFSSDQVATFNRAQVEELRNLTEAPILHNYMGRETAFDHFTVGEDLDIATWDSYPIGFLSDRLEDPPEHKARYLRQGDPDFQAFHHDLYRAVGHGRWWVMEQQPGPVNWAPHNPAPLKGMARLWAWEAIAHGADAVCYFRWRQAPMAQEQMHAALIRPDNEDAPVMEEIAQLAQEVVQLKDNTPLQARIGIVFDYVSAWAWQVQPHGADFDYFRLVFEVYRTLRKLGQNIDILPPDQSDLSGYDLVLAPGLFELDQNLMAALSSFDGTALIGPRTNTRTANFAIPVPLPPNLPDLDIKIFQTESLPPQGPIGLANGGTLIKWFEHLEGDAEVMERTTDGLPAMVRSGGLSYLAGWPDEAAMTRILTRALEAAELPITRMPEGLRQRDLTYHRVYVNYSATAQTVDGLTVPGAGVAVKRRSS